MKVEVGLLPRGESADVNRLLQSIPRQVHLNSEREVAPSLSAPNLQTAQMPPNPPVDSSEHLPCSIKLIRSSEKSAIQFVGFHNRHCKRIFQPKARLCRDQRQRR